MKKENSFLSWRWKGSCHDARFSIGDGNIGNCKKWSVIEMMFLMPQSFESHFFKVLCYCNLMTRLKLFEADKKNHAFSFPKAITKATVWKTKPQ